MVKQLTINPKLGGSILAFVHKNRLIKKQGSLAEGEGLVPLTSLF